MLVFSALITFWHAAQSLIVQQIDKPLDVAPVRLLQGPGLSLSYFNCSKCTRLYNYA